MGADLDGPRANHAYVMPSNAIGDMVATLEVAQDLSALTLADSDLDWDGFLPLYRDVLAVYDGRVAAIPAQGMMMQLYYRRDLLAAAGLQPPRTWSETVAYAAKFNGTDLNGDGAPDYGICLWRLTCDALPMSFVAILASLAQSKGRHTGLFFEPESMRPVWETAAWEAAVELARNLTLYAAPITDEPPSPIAPCFSQPLFGQGRCAMALAQPGQFKSGSSPGNPFSVVRGKIGSSILPGSERVLDWQLNALLPCDPDRCPFANLHSTSSLAVASGSNTRRLLSPQVAAATSSPVRPRHLSNVLRVVARSLLAGTAAGAVAGQPAASAAPATMWVNHAPYAASGGQSIFISRRQSEAQRLATYTLVVQMVRDAGDWPLVAGPGSEFGPTRHEHLLGDESYSRWAEYGYHPDDLASFLAATRESLESGNVALDLRAAGAFPVFKDALNEVAALITNTSMPLDSVLQATRALLTERMAAAISGDLGASYRASIRFIIPKKLPGDPLGGSKNQTTKAVVAAVVVVVGVVLLASVAAAIWVRRRRAHYNQRHFGPIVAPGAAAATTLCLTDIQDSTRLWESLPEAVMSRSLQLHNTCVRRCATAHNGYESSTEGDSFLLAFHCAQDALAFCLALQDELPTLPWPAELLAVGRWELVIAGQVDPCRPLWLVDAGMEAAVPPWRWPAARLGAGALSRAQQLLTDGPPADDSTGAAAAVNTLRTVPRLGTAALATVMRGRSTTTSMYDRARMVQQAR
ncbi:Adenylate cyclase [Tetrabaena socialis]|uniref:Adenylate cyclase n=1 Tax=Tetrabaena socialis TaxID=47790 RepID=A0A2J8A7J0_9CHLO|nr:Adenylate cyclase [Tetrabaena socialis]|eukprot:PNH08506.1 Adenylate cyclase [Tetrabaena socialis]